MTRKLSKSRCTLSGKLIRECDCPECNPFPTPRVGEEMMKHWNKLIGKPTRKY